MKKLFFFLTAMAVSVSSIFSQVYEERFLEFSSRFVGSDGKVYENDSTKIVGINGVATSVERNKFNAKGYEINSIAYKIDDLGNLEPIAKDTMSYDENDNMTKQIVYSWDGSDYIGKSDTRNFYTAEGKPDRVEFYQFDKDLYEWYLRGTHKDVYNQDGQLTHFILQASNENRELVNDMKFEYSDFNTFGNPSKGQSFLGKDDDWEPYMYIAFEYDKNGNLASVVYYRQKGDDVENIKRNIFVFDDQNRLTSWENQRPNRSDNSTFDPSQRQNYFYNTRTGVLDSITTASYRNGNWTSRNKTVNYWSECDGKEDTSVENVMDNSLQIVNGNGNIHIIASENITSVKIFSVTGANIFTADNLYCSDGIYTISTQNIPQGIHVVTVVTESGSIASKKVKL